MNNLKSYTEYAVTSSTRDFVIGFDFNYGTDAVNVTVDGVPAAEAGYTVVYLNSTTMRLTPAVTRGVVRLQRETDIDAPDNRFTAGAKFIAGNMDENFTQIRQSQQEVRDGFSKLSTDTYALIDGLDEALELAQEASQEAQAAADTVNAFIVNGKVITDKVLDDSGKTQQEINDAQKLKNKDFVFVEDYYAKGDALRPVSDLYSVGSAVYQKRFRNFADVQAFFPFVTAASDPLDWAATQKAVNENTHVRMRGVHYYWGAKTVELPINCLYFHGAGITTRIYTTGLTALKAKAGVRLVLGDYGYFYLVGNNTPNSIGFDTSAFSYCTFQNIWIREYRDGWFADGSTSPVNKQYSNNTVINVRSNNNLRDGFRLVGSSEANSANTYIGCEAAQNANIGFNETVGYSNQTVGCTFQGNTVADFYTDGTRGIHEFYAEGNPRSVKLGTLSRNNKVSVRSSYPLWNTFTDAGTVNNKSVRGELDVDQHVFRNPYFESWTTAYPTNLLPNGSVTMSWFADATLPLGGGLQATFNADFQGLILSGLDPSIDYSGRWVTVQIEADTSGVTNLSGLRIYTRDGASSNGAVGSFAVDSLTKTAAGTYKNFTFDIKFADTVAGLPSILIYLAYSGITTTNTIKIKAIKVVLGQTDRVGEYALSAKPATAIGTSFTSATSGLNTAWKSSVRFVTNTTAGKVYYPSGSSPTSPWKALDGTADIVPV